MAVPLVSANFADVLDSRFREVSMGTYEKGESFIPKVFGMVTSDKDTERYSQLTPMGKFQTFTGAVSYDGIDQGYDVVATHVEKALAVQIQRKLYDDAQFDVIDDQFSALGQSAFKTHEDDAAQFFNGAFSTTNSFYVHSEGVATCSSSHTCPRSGVSTTTGFSNYGTTELTPTSLTAAIIQFRQFKDDAGDMIDYEPNEIIFPVNLADRVEEILGTPEGLDDANKNKNVHYNRMRQICLPRLSDTNDWFLTNAELRAKNLLWLWRVKLELAKMEGFDNIIAKSRGYMRYSYLRRDWRFIYGASVS